jgi:membrane-bound lytic murein transglycosylase D
LISKNPEHYGFDVTLAEPFDFETVRLDRPVDLQHLASGAEIAVEDLQALNPELRSFVTPRQPEGYELKVPGGRREAVLLAFAAAPTAKPPDFRQYLAKKGETLPRIARRYGVSVSSLATANSLSPRTRLSRGQEILIPEKVAASTARRGTKNVTAAPRIVSAASVRSAAPPKSYRVKNGDTLYRIALRHGTTVAEILAVNSLGGAPSIKPGDKLRLPAKNKK